MHSCFSCPVPWIYLLMNISLKYFDDLIKALLKIVQLHCNSSKRGRAAWLPFPFCTGSEAGQELPPSVLDNPVSWHQFPANSAILQDPPTFPCTRVPGGDSGVGWLCPAASQCWPCPEWMNANSLFPHFPLPPGWAVSGCVREELRMGSGQSLTFPAFLLSQG